MKQIENMNIQLFQHKYVPDIYVILHLVKVFQFGRFL